MALNAFSQDLEQRFWHYQIGQNKEEQSVFFQMLDLASTKSIPQDYILPLKKILDQGSQINILINSLESQKTKHIISAKIFKQDDKSEEITAHIDTFEIKNESVKTLPSLDGPVESKDFNVIMAAIKKEIVVREALNPELLDLAVKKYNVQIPDGVVIGGKALEKVTEIALKGNCIEVDFSSAILWSQKKSECRNEFSSAYQKLVELKKDNKLLLTLGFTPGDKDLDYFNDLILPAIIKASDLKDPQFITGDDQYDLMETLQEALKAGEQTFEEK